MTAVYPEKPTTARTSPHETVVPQEKITELSDLGRTEVSWGQQNVGLLKDLVKLRTDFVVAMGWREAVNADGSRYVDGDRYDSDPHTLHTALRDPESGDIKAALRLTQVDSLEGSLSYSMLDGNKIMQQKLMLHDVDAQGLSPAEDLNAAAEREELWDLTRLVSPLDGSVNIEDIKDSMLEIFSYSLARTTPDFEESDPRWIFLTTSKLRFMLDYMGIEHEVLVSGKVSDDDDDESHFCVVKPVKALKSIFEHPEGRERAHDRLQMGLAKAALAL